MKEKIILRNKIREKKRQFTQIQLDELSRMIIQRLLHSDRVKNAQTIILYYSLHDEVNTHHLIDLLSETGKKILLPYVKDDTEMELREYGGPDDLRKGCYGIMEPTGNTFTNLETIDVAVIPGMSFDSNGNRLGRGKGYYDRFLKKIPDVYKIGICFDFQKVDNIPTGLYDVKMDEII